MKVFNSLHKLPNCRYIFLAFSLLYGAQLWSIPDFNSESPALVLSNITGNLWVEIDANMTYDGESGPTGVRVLLYDNEEDTIVAESVTTFGKYEFNGIAAGKYYIRIDNSAFDLGGPLSGHQSCVGVNDADNMIDNDDNGSDTTPNDVLSSTFNLTNTDPMNTVSIEYVDFCFNFVCEDQNEVTSLSCEQISTLDIICDIRDLDNFCSIMPVDSSAGNQPSPLCDGFSNSENITWFAFIGADELYNIRINPFDCQTGNIGQQGIQVGIYTDCTFSDLVFCSNLCTTNPISISSSILIPGQVYYLYINGCNSTVCNYQIDITGDPNPPSLEPEDICIFSGGTFLCEDLSYCPNSDIIIQGQGVNFNGDYNWSITTLSGDPYLGDPSPITNGNTLILDFLSEGTYEVCLSKVENGCIDQTWSGMLCRTITTTFSIPMPPDEDFGEFFVCEGDIQSFSVNVFASADPNGDGDPGWNAPISPYVLGHNEGTVYIEGCSYEQEFTLTEYPLKPVEDVLVSVCEEDFPIQIDVFTFTTFSFGGQQTISLDNVILENTQDENGCDSIINLTVERLNVLQGFIEPPICTMDGIDLKFNYISDLSTDVSCLGFEWLDPSNNTLFTGADLTAITVPFESGDGVYTLEVTINKNGVSCLFTYFTLVEVALFLPPTPSIIGPDIICPGDEIATYTAQGDGEEISFIWSFPNDVASAMLSGDNNEILTVDWTGSNGGDISLIEQNTCGQSETSTIEIQIIPTTTPNFSIDTSVCSDIITTIDFIGTGINISSYQWDFDGGIVTSGSGMGPYEISWNIAGEKFVSLTTTDTNGCQSNQTIKSINVVAPLTPTQVACTSSLGEIIFSWEIPLMVSGFEINVLTGQTGGIFTANSFTIAGLSEGETVTIELLTKPEDPVCGEFVSTLVTCMASDCIPPTLELEAESSVCVDDDNITINATVTSGETGTGVFSGPGIVDDTNGVFDPSLANIGINTIVYTFTSDVANCSASESITIGVFDLPIASFNQDLDTMCIIDELNLEYSGTASAETYDWNFDGGQGSGLLTNQQVTFNSSGLKTISLQVTKNGCTSTVFSSTVFVEPELEDVNIQCDSISTDFLIFSWNNIAGVSLFEITIDSDPSFFSSNTSITVDNLEEEQFVSIIVTSISDTSCPGSTNSLSCITTKTPVSVESEVLANVKLYPNPVQDLLFIEGVSSGQKLSFELYSIIGTSLSKADIKDQPVDLSNYPTGIYIMRISEVDSGLYKDYKVVKE